MARRGEKSNGEAGSAPSGVGGSEGLDRVVRDGPITENGNRDGSFGTVDGANGVEGSAGGTGGAENGTSAPGIGEPVPDIPAPKKRGRKSAAEKARIAGEAFTAVQRNILDPKEIAPQIQGLHALLATITKQPVFVLTNEEAKNMAIALSEVSKHYNINVMSGPRASLVSLAAVCGMIYIPKVVLIRNQRKAQKASAETNPTEADVMAAMAGDASTVNYGGLN